MTGPVVVLIGPMGAGKTRIGRSVAKQLDVGFLDTDKMVVAEHGPIADIFDSAGEAAFRELEREAVVRAMASDGVVSLGGGAVLNADTAADLEERRVVLLTVSAEAVAARLASGTRPLVRGGIADWQRITDARMPLYTRLAGVTFDTSRIPTSRIAEEVARWLRT